jgi:4-alpha-glucanotransferase
LNPMPQSSTPLQLVRLAHLYGIQTSYRDMRNRKQDASPESLLAALQVLGAPVRSMDDVKRALLWRRQDVWKRTIEPVIVAWEGEVPPITVRTTEGVRGSLSYMLFPETGDPISAGADLSRLPTNTREEIAGTRYVSNTLSIRRRLPPGYHRLSIEVNGRLFETLVIATPSQAYFPFDRKEWGLFVPIYALHSARTPNSGDLTDLEKLIDWMGALGGRVAGTLPILAAFLDQPFEPSPYAPASRLFWNEFYVDVGVKHRATKTDLVDYRTEMKFRRGVLEREAMAFFNSWQPEGRSQFQAFVNREREVERYAEFRAATEQHGMGWSQWPPALRDGVIRRGDYDERLKLYHLFAQWKIQCQLGALADKTKRAGQVFYLDLPLGLHREGYDVWRYRDLFVQDAAGGAPPDLVFTKGQNWGFPPMHPEVMRFRHHDYTIAYIRNHLRFAHLLRIDHVMGLHRLFWIPKGLTGENGVYVQYPAEELYAILCLESHRNRAGIIGENLGTVPPNVNASMKHHNIQQMYVVQYEITGKNPKRALRSVPGNTIASLNTHDMPPFRAFLEALDVADRRGLKLLNNQGAAKERKVRKQTRDALVQFLRHRRLLGEEKRAPPDVIFRATTEFLSSSMAKIVLINVEDLWQEIYPQNVPATSRERPNWRRRTRLSLEEIMQDERILEVLRAVERLRRK